MEPAPSNTGYYIVEQNQKKGPFDLSMIESMKQQGILAEDSLIWVDGMQNWEPARQVVPQIFSHAVTADQGRPQPQLGTTLSIADPKWRFLGGVIDACILYLPMQVILVPLFAAGGVGVLGEFLVAIVYEALLMASNWQGTVGMKVLGLQVVDYSGNKISLGQSFGRSLFSLISWLPFPPFCVGFWMLFFTARRQTLHDIMAKTLVVRSK